MSMQRVGDIELNQDLDFQRRSFTVQRVSWILFCLVLLAAFAGLFGAGPLSSATAGKGSPLQVQYGRFVRHRAPTEMKVQLQAGAVQGEEARVWVDREYLDQIELQKVVPEPDTVEVGGDRLIYVFKLSNPGDPAGILFDIMPVTVGRHLVRVGLEGGPEHTFSQFIYP